MSLSMLADAASWESGAAIALVLLFVVGLLAVAALIVAAVFSILFSRVDGAMKVVWLIFVVIAPVIGAVLWFLVGRRRTPA